MRAIITLEELQTACTLLERACLNDQRATEGELALARPGAQDTQDAGAEPWLRYYGWLRILHKGGSTGANNGAASAPASAVEGMSGLSAAEALRAMVHAEPKRVVLELDRDSVDARYPKGMVVHVYPKSVPTLWWLCSLDAQVRRLAEGARQALALEEETDDRLLATFPLQRGLAEMVWAWILTTPGAGMPFDPNAAQADDPPAHFALLSASDLLALYLAHREIHDTRQRVAGAYYGNTADEVVTRLPLDGMLAAFLAEKGGGQRPADVLQLWSLNEIAGVGLSDAALHREATKRAEQRAETARAARGA